WFGDEGIEAGFRLVEEGIPGRDMFRLALSRAAASPRTRLSALKGLRRMQAGRDPDGRWGMYAITQAGWCTFPPETRHDLTWWTERGCPGGRGDPGPRGECPVALEARLANAGRALLEEKADRARELDREFHRLVEERRSGRARRYQAGRNDPCP